MTVRALSILLALCAVATAAPVVAPPAPTGRVVDVAVDGEIDAGLAAYLERVLDAAQPGDGVVLRVNTFGGRVDSAVGIRDALLRCKGRTLAFVEGRAISAGALITLATDRIYMTRGATMGAATPIQLEGGKMAPVEAKIVSYFRAEMKSTAEAKGRRGDVAEAMVDPSVEIKDVDGPTTTLTLTTEQAKKLAMIDGEADTLEAALAAAGWSHPVQHVSMNWAEKLAQFLSDSSVSSLLMTLGMIGILIELWAPGHLLAGVCGALCLALFFFGHWVIHLAGLGEVLLFVIGAGLVVVEVLFLPGHGAMAALGIAGIIASLVMAIVGRGALPFDVAWATGSVTHALVMVSGALLASVAAMFIVARYLPTSRFGKVLVLDAAIRGEAGDESTVLLVGVVGRALTALRPAGTMDVDGRRIDVVSAGEFIEPGASIRVVNVEGARVVVQRVPSSSS